MDSNTFQQMSNHIKDYARLMANKYNLFPAENNAKLDLNWKHNKD